MFHAEMTEDTHKSRLPDGRQVANLYALLLSGRKEEEFTGPVAMTPPLRYVLAPGARRILAAHVAACNALR
jgi:hypothetical protein